MKKNKGFTLIELLAVLVILSIIALIITPIVTNLIKDAREKAAKDAMEGLVDAVEIYYGRQVMKTDGTFNGNANLTLTFKSDGTVTPSNTTNIDTSIVLEYDGYKVKAGTVTITRFGVITASNVEINGYICQYTNNTVSCAEKA